MKIQYVAYLMLFIAGIWGGSLLVANFSSPSHSTTSLKPPPVLATNFSLPDLEDKSHQFDEWKGKIRVLNFWATWCPPCRKETPMFVELQEKLAAQGVQFIGVAIDEKQKTQDFIDTFGVTYPILYGADNAIAVATAYGDRLGMLPWTVVIDRQGSIVYTQAGEFTRQHIESVLHPLLTTQTSSN